MASGEDNEQIALFRWADFAMGRFPELALMHHIPNGGSRNAREGAKLKRMGVRAGVCDVFLPAARGDWHGLYIEMKYGKNKPTAEQRLFMDGVKKQGYNIAVCYS